MMYLLLALFLILGKYIPDALYDNGKKMVAGIIEWVYMAVVFAVMFAWFNYTYPTWMHTPVFSYWKLIVGSILLWYAIGDASYNIVRGLPIFYLGTTKIPDRWIRRFLDWTKFSDDAFLGTTKFIALIWGVLWLLIQKP